MLTWNPLRKAQDASASQSAGCGEARGAEQSAVYRCEVMPPQLIRYRRNLSSDFNRLFPATFTGVGADDGSRLAAGGFNNPIVYSRLGSGLSVNQLITDFGRTSNLVQISEASSTSAGSSHGNYSGADSACHRPSLLWTAQGTGAPQGGTTDCGRSAVDRGSGGRACAGAS